MSNKDNKLPPEIQGWLLKEIADIMTGTGAGGGEDFTLISTDGMTEISIIVVTKPLGDKIEKFVEKELSDDDGVEFTAL
jgi:hypothetical protein